MSYMVTVTLIGWVGKQYIDTSHLWSYTVFFPFMLSPP